MLVGLTGAYCAGKNHVGRLLEERGFEVLDIDTLGHEALGRSSAAIADLFGPGVLGPDGKVDRRKLGEIAFGDPAALRALEGIVHPEANRMTEEWIAERPGRDLVLNAALLHLSAAFPRLDFVILVRAPFLTRLARARVRDGLTIPQALARFRAQKGFEAQYFGKGADIQIAVNRGGPGPCGRRADRALRNRLDAILDLKGWS